MKGQSWYQSSCIDPKNLMGKKLKPRIIILGVFSPRGSTPGHPVCRNYEKNGFTTHFWPFIWALRSWGPIFFILEYETTNIEDYFSNFFFSMTSVLLWLLPTRPATTSWSKFLFLNSSSDKDLFDFNPHDGQQQAEKFEKPRKIDVSIEIISRHQ